MIEWYSLKLLGSFFTIIPSAPTPYRRRRGRRCGSQTIDPSRSPFSKSKSPHLIKFFLNEMRWFWIKLIHRSDCLDSCVGQLGIWFWEGWTARIDRLRPTTASKTPSVQDRCTPSVQIEGFHFSWANAKKHRIYVVHFDVDYAQCHGSLQSF